MPNRYDRLPVTHVFSQLAATLFIKYEKMGKFVNTIKLNYCFCITSLHKILLPVFKSSLKG